MLEGFEKFTQHGRSFKPKISIRKRGQIGFNNGAIKRFGLNNYEFVVLYIDKERTKIAFNFTNSVEDDGAIKLVKKKNNYFMSGKSFLDYYNIPYGKSQAYEVDWNPETMVAIIDIGAKDDEQEAQDEQETSLQDDSQLDQQP